MSKSDNFMRQWNGPLTADLLRQSGEYGLGQVPAELKPDAVTALTCGYCSTGCSLEAHLIDGQAVNITPDIQYPVNLGMACPKGWESLTVTQSSDRAVHPLIRPERGKKAKRATWDEALKLFTSRFKGIQEKHGKDSVAFISTGQIPTEEMVLLGSLAKFGMGILHGDGNTRQCMATSVVAYKQSFGFDAPPYTYQDFEESDVIVLVGSNLCIAHPIMWQRILRNPHKPEIIVVDPRKTETAMCATEHVPLYPKSDLNLFYGLAHILVRNDWIDRDFISQHTTGFDEFAIHLEMYSPERVSRDTGVDIESLNRIAEKIHNGERVSFWWTMGVNQSYQGVRTAQSLINLALMTGNIGRPGTGANSITGQCNAMGSRLFSNTTNLLGGHDFVSESDREKVAGILDIPVANIPGENSLSYHEILDRVLDGKIKGLWVIATNPAHSWINQNMCHDILERLDFLAVQDMYSTTETAQLADLILPAAGWGEKDGTFINSERRFGILKKVSRAPGEALSDFYILKLIARYWGCEDLFTDWEEPEDVFQSMKELSRGQPCDITGIRDYQMLDAAGGIQWPCPDSSTPDRSRERRLFADGAFYHDDQRARFIFDKPRRMPELPNDKYPFILMTGRGTAAQWHTQTRTSKSETLKSLYPQEVYVELNPNDANECGIKPSEKIMVESQRGSIQANVLISPSVQPGQVFIPMHYREVNKLTHAHFDPYSKQPSYKDCAVRLCKASELSPYTSSGDMS